VAVDKPGSTLPSRQASDDDLGGCENDDESLSVEIPPADYTTYAFCRGIAYEDSAAYDQVRSASGPGHPAALQQATDGKYEYIYDYVDEPDLHAYLQPSPCADWYEPRSLKFSYSRRHLSRRTLLSGTLLLVDSDDRHVTGCDVTQSVLALDRQGSAFYVPMTSLRRFDDPSGQPWLYPTPLSPHQATIFVAAQRQKGCFVVYKPAGEETSVEGRPEYVLAVGLPQSKSRSQICQYQLLTFK